MKVIITGSDGFLGANLTRYLMVTGHEVIGTALNRKNGMSLDALAGDICLEYGDVTDSAFVERVVNAYEPDVVYHLAAVSIVRIADANPARAIKTNVLGTLNVVDACKRAGVRCIAASSDKAYGDHGGVPYTEDMPLKPTGAYEVSKAGADMVARLYGAIVTRCANLYGPGDMNFSRLVPNSCRLALRGEPPELTPGAWQYRREWVYVNDACWVYALLGEKGVPGEAYNIGFGQVFTAGIIAHTIANMAGSPQPITVDRNQGCYEIPEQRLDNSKQKALAWPWSYEPALMEEGLRVTLDWYREYMGYPVKEQLKVDSDAGARFMRGLKLSDYISQPWPGHVSFVDCEPVKGDTDV